MRGATALCAVLIIPVCYAAYCCTEAGYGHDWILFENLVDGENDPMATYLNNYAKFYERSKLCEMHSIVKERDMPEPRTLEEIQEHCVKDSDEELQQRYAELDEEDSDFDPEIADTPVYCIKSGDHVSFRKHGNQWSSLDDRIQNAVVILASGKTKQDNGCSTKFNVRFNYKDEPEIQRHTADLSYEDVRLYLVPECLTVAKENSIGYHSSGFLNGVQDDDARTTEIGCVVDGPGNAIHYPVSDHASRSVGFLMCMRYANRNKVQWKLTTWIALRETVMWLPREWKILEFDRTWAKSSSLETAVVKLEKNSVEAGSGENCRDFVHDYKDVLQYLSMNHASPQLWQPPYLRYIDTLSSAAFGAPQKIQLSYHHTTRAVPPSLVLQRNYHTPDSCAAMPVVEAQYVFQPPFRIMEAEYRKQIAAGKVADQPEYCFAANEENKALEARDLSVTELSPKATDFDFGDDKTVSISVDERLTEFPGYDESCPAVLIDSKGVLDQAQPLPKEDHGNSKSLASSSKAINALSTYSSYQALQASGYSASAIKRGAVWLEDKLGVLGTGLAIPLRFLAVVANGAYWVMTQTLLVQAKLGGFCPVDSTKQECICDVIEPMVDLVKEVTSMSTKEKGEFEIESGAFTLLFHGSLGSHASVVGAGVGGGIYVQFQWSPRWEFEIGGYGGAGTSVVLGTDAIKAGVDARFKVGVFLGRKDEMGAWSKGVSIGANVWIGAAVGIDFLFRQEFVDSEGITRCAPIDYMAALGGVERPELADAMGNGLLRMLLMPVNPKCIRGAYVAIHANVKTTPTGVDFNVNTAYGIGKKIAFLTVNSDDLHSEAIEMTQALAATTLGHDVIHRTAVVADDLATVLPHHRRQPGRQIRRRGSFDASVYSPTRYVDSDNLNQISNHARRMLRPESMRARIPGISLDSDSDDGVALIPNPVTRRNRVDEDVGLMYSEENGTAPLRRVDHSKKSELRSAWE